MEKWCTRHWVNVVRIGLEFGRGGEGSGLKRGGVPAG